jgi:secondary thiamine-phosphate synthase enzyme
MVKQFQLTIQTQEPHQLVDLTGEIRAAVRGSGVHTGVCHVFVAGATAGILLNEGDDPALREDLLDLLDKVVPQGRWRHDRIDDNGAAHLKSAWVGASETVPVQGGDLLLGTWQSLFLCEFDGPREARPIWVTVQGE